MMPLLLAVTLLDPTAASRFVELALSCVDREYPNKIAHVMNSDKDVRPPRDLTPAFFGCFDWHSSVHGHWLLARIARTFPGTPFAGKARDILERHITPAKMAQEAAYLTGEGRATFERPYGLAWLLQLAQELREWDDADARRWSANLKVLEEAAVKRLEVWLPKLSHPERTGVHSQSAFALGLMHDSSAHHPAFRTLVERRIRDFYLKDKNCPVQYEPSGQDFLSPCLAEADAVRRVLNPAEFASWLDALLQDIPLQPETVTDPTDGQLAHLDGLNLSRAWMLEGIAAGLPATHKRRASILELAQKHRDAGLASVTGEHYEGGHWLGSFAVYLVTSRGLASPAQPASKRVNQVGSYGPWLAAKVLGDGPARLSFRTGKWKSVDQWRQVARKRALECIAPVDLGGTPVVTVTGRTTYDGLDIEFLTWQLPAGPKTEAVLLKPSGARGRLPGILALHDHGANKFLGWRKITRTDASPWEIQEKHQAEYYGGVGWANEIAKRGYVVLVHDTFPFASRRVLVQDVPPNLHAGGVDPSPQDLAGIAKYNEFASAHEHVMEKSLLSAGTTWPGVYLVEDQRALDVLSSRPDVDASRLGCAGLSGGGMRTVFLGGLDDRIKVAVAVGFMTTWRDFLLDKAYTHTWMTYVPLLPKDLDFPEILALRGPAATMVLNCKDDPLYTLPEMQRADTILAETFKRANAAERYRAIYYDGGHKFDRKMQADAFDWMDRFLKAAPAK